MKFFYFFIFLFIFLSCKKSENQKADVDVTIQTITPDADYNFSDYYTNPDGIKIRIEVLQFYIADVRFVNKNGKEFSAGEIALVKCDMNGTGSMSLKVPAGDYTSVKFGIGVPADMNAAGPGEYNEVDHPLNALQGTYWSMNSSYRFVMIDGKYDLTGDGTDDGGFSYHTGFDDCYREIELTHDFSFDRRGTYAEKLVLDVTKLFYISGSEIDVPTESNFHGEVSAIDLALRLSDNFANALTVE